jgi:hypothetical protein
MSFSAQNLEKDTIYDLDALTQTETAGTYPVTFQYQDENGNVVKKTVYITLMYLRTIISEEYGEGIDAYDIEIQQGMFEKLSDTDLKKLANAHAWRTDNGMEVAIVEVDRMVINKNLSKYQVTFKTANQTATTINVVETIVDETRNTLYSYFSFWDTLDIWWIFFFVPLFMLFPVILMFYNYLKLRKEVRKAHILLYNEKIE